MAVRIDRFWRGMAGWPLVVGLGLALVAAVAGGLPGADGEPSAARGPGERLGGRSGLDLGLGPKGGLRPKGGVRELSLSAGFKVSSDGHSGQLSITADLAPGWHIYSTTQPRGGPARTVIEVDPSDQFELTGSFQPDRPPRVRKLEFFRSPVEEHYERVTWTAPVRLTDGADARQLVIRGQLDGQVCHDEGSCIPLDQLDAEFTAQWAGVLEAGPAAPPPRARAPGGSFRVNGSHAQLEGRVEPGSARPGEVLQLVIRATPDPGWHIYALAARDPKKIAKPTLIGLAETSGLQASPPVASAAPREKQTGLPAEPVLRLHEQPVEWRVDLRVPPTFPLGPCRVSGVIGYQTCSDTTCDMPVGAQFSAEIAVSDARTSDRLPLSFTSSTYTTAAKLAAQAPPPASVPIVPARLAINVGFALLGGLLLNLMPCVLPVIGLKILSFVEQAGHQRGRIFTLNLVYAAGLIAVFLVLGTLAAFLNLGWGEQFTLTWFKVTMTALVFVMALSFLGVWELPVPGFVGMGKPGTLAAREGAAGAFFKGVFTTILATPCSGPFLGPVFGYTLDQPPLVTYAIFFSVGLGMASPYLLIGANPRLIRFLPRPGAWMDTFKQLMGFLLLATVVYLFSTLSGDYFIPTLALLVALWHACWWIGRIPATADTPRRIRSWIGAAATAAALGIFAFRVLVAGESQIPWQPFTPDGLARAKAEGKTVLLQFTADWCPNCKYNLKYAIDTPEVARVVTENDVVPLLADWTDRSGEIKESLAQLGSRSIPLLAVFPADQPGDPIVLPDVLREAQVLEALQAAGPSRTAQRPAWGMRAELGSRPGGAASMAAEGAPR